MVSFFDVTSPLHICKAYFLKLPKIYSLTTAKVQERSRQDSKNWRAHIRKNKLTYFYFSNPVLACKQDIHFVSLILRAFSTKSSVSTYRKQVSYLAKYITLVCWAMDFQTYFYQVDLSYLGLPAYNSID